MTNKFAQVVIGPAGSGKSTYVKRMADHYETLKRAVHCVNMDPAADYLPYSPDVDIRDAISTQEVMQRYKIGPNGALVCCLELISKGRGEWFDDVIGSLEYDYLLIDFPGQIEIYSHMTILPDLMAMLQDKGYNVIAIYCMDSQFMGDPAKFLSGSLVALSSMTMVTIPRMNVLTKCELLTEADREQIDWFTEMEASAVADNVKTPSLQGLTTAISELFDNFRIVQWQLLDSTDDTMVADLATEIDTIIQYFDTVDYGDPEFAQDVEQ